MQGRFVTIEGGEGAGKSTNIEYIKEVLLSAGKKVVHTREPGGTEVGERIRALLLDKNVHNLAVETELLLMFAARLQHINEVIIPTLNAGTWVLCDRFTDASYAYQGGGRGIPFTRIEQLETWVQGSLRPDLTLLLDVPVEVGFSRVHDRGELDRFENEHKAFFENVRHAYLQLAKQHSSRIRIIDAAEPIECVQNNLRDILVEFCTHDD